MMLNSKSETILETAALYFQHLHKAYISHTYLARPKTEYSQLEEGRIYFLTENSNSSTKKILMHCKVERSARARPPRFES